ncbi:MAG TPA: hypothetical protein VJM79_08940 [Rhizorhapis sp.]|nr:hypothetical protein [Rhizorhapis sp.]
MERKLLQIEKAWEQALGNIFQPYTGTARKPAMPPADAFQSSSHDIRRHMAKTAARQGSTALHQYLQDEYWGKRPY